MADVTVNTTNQQLLPVNTGRTYVMVQNRSATTDVYINVDGSTNDPTTGGFLLPPGGMLPFYQREAVREIRVGVLGGQAAAVRYQTGA